MVAVALLGAGCAQTAPAAVMGPLAADGLPAHVDLRVRGKAQRRNLSCESRSAADLLAWYGVPGSEAQVLAALPLSDNPDLGFVGSVDGPTGQLPPKGYGVHAGPIAAVLTRAGVPADARMGVTFDSLRRTLASGRPAIVWATSHLKPSEPVWLRDRAGRTFRAVAGEHTFLLTGYDAGRVLLVDSATGRERWVTRERFERAFDLLGRMAVVPRISRASAVGP